jgi:hypothetical protein
MAAINAMVRTSRAAQDFRPTSVKPALCMTTQNDGKHVHRPMPVFAKMTTPQAVSIFAYLTSLK